MGLIRNTIIDRTIVLPVLLLEEELLLAEINDKKNDNE